MLYHVTLSGGEILLLIHHNKGYIEDLASRHDEYVKNERDQKLYDDLINSHQKRIDELYAILDKK